MYNIIPLILILISLSVIIIIIGKKFSLLANLDVENIQSEKEAKFKERIISNRFERNLIKYYNIIKDLVGPFGQNVQNIFKSFFNKLLEIKEKYREDKRFETIDIKQKINQLFLEAEELKKGGDIEKAERKLIEIIAIDSKNIDAFKNLGRLYLENKNYNEAKQTFEHILKLIETNQEVQDYFIKTSKGDYDIDNDNSILFKLPSIYFDLALTYQALEDFDVAILNLKKALEIEPNNPKYLDTLLEISIIKKDKGLAVNTLEKLKKANPENQKLMEFEKRINEM